MLREIIPNIDRLESAALNTIIEEGFDYPVKVTVVNEYFKTRRVYGEENDNER